MAAERHVFLRLGIAQQALQVNWINRDGRRIFDVALAAAELTPK